MRTILCLALLSSTIASADQKILVPVFFNANGSGAAWRSALGVLNRGARDFQSPGAPFVIGCGIPEGCISDRVPPFMSGSLFGLNAPGGLLFTLPDDFDTSKVVLRLGIAARPRNALYGGTDLPLVRERDFLTSRITLPFLAIGADERPKRRGRLRIYDPDAHDGAQVRVSLKRPDAAAPDFPADKSIVVPLSLAPIDLSPNLGMPAPPRPAYAEIDLGAAFADTLPNGTIFNIEIEPVTPGLRLWAFVTLTDNATNEVTAITPQ